MEHEGTYESTPEKVPGRSMPRFTLSEFFIIVGRGMVAAAIALLAFTIGLFIFGAWHDDWTGYSSQYQVSDGYCNIAVIPVHDQISSYTYYDELTGEEILSSTLDDFEYALRNAENDLDILGVLVSVDSGGGSPYAGEAMANDLARSPLPTVAVVRDMAASSAYFLATGADEIIASVFSNVGSIGITMSYVELVDENESLGRHYIEISSGPFKDSGNPEKPLSEEEYALFMRDIDRMHEAFVSQVALKRNLPRESVAAIADGSTMLGPDALAAGLIDQIGDKETARQWFADELGMEFADVVLCE